MKIEEIARITGGELRGGSDGNAPEIFRAASLVDAGENEISFAEKAGSAIDSNAACLFIPENTDFPTFNNPVIVVKNPKLAFARIAAILHQPLRKTGIDPTAQIHESAVVGADVFVGAFVSIGENSVVGAGTQIFEGARIGENVLISENCSIRSNVVVYERVSIGANVVLHSGAIIGADGFGFVRDGENGYVKFPQIGTVRIGDAVEIGANTCIDRGALGETVIGAGTKIDNLVQIGHNVRIGKRVVIAAQTGISGSTVIEDDCVIGGQVGIGDHARVLSGAIVGSQAGILPGKIVRAGVWWGTPVQPLDEYKRQNAHLKGIARLKEEVKELKKQISRLIKSERE